MNIKSLLSLLNKKGYSEFTGNFDKQLELNFISGKRPNSITILFLNNSKFNLTFNIKKTVFNIDKSIFKEIDENELMKKIEEI